MDDILPSQLRILICALKRGSISTREIHEVDVRQVNVHTDLHRLVANVLLHMLIADPPARAAKIFALLFRHHYFRPCSARLAFARVRHAVALDTVIDGHSLVFFGYIFLIYLLKKSFLLCER
jgi:hypothetical protein